MENLHKKNKRIRKKKSIREKLLLRIFGEDNRMKEMKILTRFRIGNELMMNRFGKMEEANNSSVCGKMIKILKHIFGRSRIIQHHVKN